VNGTETVYMAAEFKRGNPLEGVIFRVITATNMKMIAFWYVAQCSLVEARRYIPHFCRFLLLERDRMVD
jgi:hypothetical protein